MTRFAICDSRFANGRARPPGEPIVFYHPAPRIRFSNAINQVSFSKAINVAAYPVSADAMLEQLQQAIRARAFLIDASANAQFTQLVADVLDQYLRGELDLASARAQLSDLLDHLDYAPEPGAEGTLQDLSTDQRLNLILETNASIAAGYGQFVSSTQSPAVLDAFPAWEFKRAYPRKKPRDTGPLPWLVRWQMAGGTLVDGQMIARKDDEVWTKLGSSALFPDGLDNPYPPFAFNSGMDVFEVSRRQAEDAGVISPDENVDPPDLPDFNDGFSVEAPVDDALQKSLEALGYTVNDDGTASLPN